MEETFVRLVCPACTKDWQQSPSKLPSHDDSFQCPDCSERRRMAEFARTDRDLETLKQLA